MVGLCNMINLDCKYYCGTEASNHERCKSCGCLLHSVHAIHECENVRCDIDHTQRSEEYPEYCYDCIDRGYYGLEEDFFWGDSAWIPLPEDCTKGHMPSEETGFCDVCQNKVV